MAYFIPKNPIREHQQAYHGSTCTLGAPTRPCPLNVAPRSSSLVRLDLYSSEKSEFPETPDTPTPAHARLGCGFCLGHLVSQETGVATVKQRGGTHESEVVGGTFCLGCV